MENVARRRRHYRRASARRVSLRPQDDSRVHLSSSFCFITGTAASSSYWVFKMSLETFNGASLDAQTLTGLMFKQQVVHFYLIYFRKIISDIPNLPGELVFK